MGPERTEQLIQSYRESIRGTLPVGEFVNNQATGSTVVYCSVDRHRAFARGAEFIDWYRHQQRLRDAIVWPDHEISKLPETYGWHYQRTLADTARPDETSSLDLVRRKPE